jgi:hypothetical protein
VQSVAIPPYLSSFCYSVLRTLQYADRIINIDDGRISGSERPKLPGAKPLEAAAH